MEVTTVKQTINYLTRAKLLSPDRQFSIDVDKSDETETYCYKRCEVDAMILQCREEGNLIWLGDVLVGLAYTGMRIGELAQVRWSDADLSNKRLILPDRSRSAVQARRVRTNKNRSSRSFPIHDQLTLVLKKLESERTGKYIFVASRGGALRPNNVLTQFKKRVIDKLKSDFPSEEDDVGFKDGTLHSFQHYFCSWCANSGIPERVVMNWLGHKDSAMVRRYYHLSDLESQRQMAKLDSIGGSGTA